MAYLFSGTATIESDFLCTIMGCNNNSHGEVVPLSICRSAFY